MLDNRSPSLPRSALRLPAKESPPRTRERVPAPLPVAVLAERNGGNHLPAFGGKRFDAPRKYGRQHGSQGGNEHDVDHCSTSAARASSDRTLTSVSTTGIPNPAE